MPALLLIVFATLPLLEIVIVLYVGDLLGLWPTVGLLLANSVAGVWLLRREGRRVIYAFRDAVAHRQMPTAAVVNGTAVAVGAALLITPGFLTDLFGFVLLIPFTRAGVVAAARAYLLGRFRL